MFFNVFIIKLDLGPINLFFIVRIVNLCTRVRKLLMFE